MVHPTSGSGPPGTFTYLGPPSLFTSMHQVRSVQSSQQDWLGVGTELPVQVLICSSLQGSSKVNPQGSVLAQVLGDLATPGTRTHTVIPTYPPSGLDVSLALALGIHTHTPPPPKDCWHKVVWDLQDNMSGEVTTQPRGLGQGNLSRKGW